MASLRPHRKPNGALAVGPGVDDLRDHDRLALAQHAAADTDQGRSTVSANDLSLAEAGAAGHLEKRLRGAQQAEAHARASLAKLECRAADATATDLDLDLTQPNLLVEVNGIAAFADVAHAHDLDLVARSCRRVAGGVAGCVGNARQHDQAEADGGDEGAELASGAEHLGFLRVSLTNDLPACRARAKLEVPEKTPNERCAPDLCRALHRPGRITPCPVCRPLHTAMACVSSPAGREGPVRRAKAVLSSTTPAGRPTAWCRG